MFRSDSYQNQTRKILALPLYKKTRFLSKLKIFLEKKNRTTMIQNPICCINLDPNHQSHLNRCTNCKEEGHTRDQCWFLYSNLGSIKGWKVTKKRERDREKERGDKIDELDRTSGQYICFPLKCHKQSNFRSSARASLTNLCAAC